MILCPRGAKTCSLKPFCQFSHEATAPVDKPRKLVHSGTQTALPLPQKSEKTQRASSGPSKRSVLPLAHSEPERPQKKPKPASQTSVSTAGSGVPIILGSLHSLVPREKRQKALEKFFIEFQRIYGSLLSAAPRLAHDHALAQEAQIHAKSSEKTYSNHVVSCLLRLRRRVLAENDQDVGIDGEWVDKSPIVSLKPPIPLASLFELLMTPDNLRVYGYPLESLLDASALETASPADPLQLGSTEAAAVPRQAEVCARCSQKFLPMPLDDSNKASCTYHWGRRRTKITLGIGKDRVWTCCQGDLDSEGCTVGPHVFKKESTLDTSKFMQLPHDGAGGSYAPVLALDCEMSYTTGGLELVRCTALDWYGETVLDRIIKPSNPVLDFNTRFSGISTFPPTAQTLDEFMAEFSTVASSQTILIGHGLENDLVALKLVHNRVIDTAQVYPHPHSLPMRHSLQQLAQVHLKRFIQGGEHDSREDALACLDLVKLLIKS
ncbi:RNA exonuclease 3 [Kappamyces sp. JEL0829]|nr:RNA exonuclease 3 [Kappamyces sp. JEL0829]